MTPREQRVNNAMRATVGLLPLPLDPDPLTILPDDPYRGMIADLRESREHLAEAMDGWHSGRFTRIDLLMGAIAGFVIGLLAAQALHLFVELPV
jgi:hypothetical protein